MKIVEINRKSYPTLVRVCKVGELDKSKFSNNFLSHNLSDDKEVYVKCFANGEFDYRGKNNEYRTIVPDEVKDEVKNAI